MRRQETVSSGNPLFWLENHTAEETCDTIFETQILPNSGVVPQNLFIVLV